MQDLEETLVKLLESGFAAAKKTNSQINIFANEKLIEVVKDANMNVPEERGDKESIGNIIIKNKANMKKGDIEGIVLTIHDDAFGFLVVKWKGAHKFQLGSKQNAMTAYDLIQNSEVDENLKRSFETLRDVLTDRSENIHLIKRDHRHKLYMDKIAEYQKEKTIRKLRSKYLSNMDKEIIHHGIFHSQKKFDSLRRYVGAGRLEEYINALIREVRVHLAEEKGNFHGVDDDDNILAFIQYKVNAIVRPKVAALG